MTARSSAFAVLATAWMLIACGGDDVPTAPGAIDGPPAGTDAEIVELVDLVNARRADAGCAGLAWHADVADVAEAHSQDMQDRNFFSHTNPDGDDPFERLAAAGIAYATAGENLAMGTGDGGQAFQLWIDSPGHRANIENCAYTHHGVGLVSGRWTHVFVGDPAD